MTNIALLNAKIDESGLKRNHIAKQLGITPQGFHLKTSGKNEFNSTQIQILCKILKITTQKETRAIFFAPEVDAKSTE